MALYTSNYFKNLAERKSYSITEELRMFSSKSVNENEKFDIFLSHSFLDKNEVYGIYLELKSKGYKVYVDWIVDSHLDRNNVTKKSAELIRNRLKNSNSLLLAISSNSAVSKWIPWELGYVDGNVNSCAILPISKDSTRHYTYKRVEYLLLYPYIKTARVDMGSEKIYVVESSNSYVDFQRWVSYKRNPEYNSKNINIL